jgi:hypothetical protein
MDTIISLADAFVVIHDPRIDRTKKHKLVDILEEGLAQINN